MVLTQYEKDDIQDEKQGYTHFTTPLLQTSDLSVYQYVFPGTIQKYF